MVNCWIAAEHALCYIQKCHPRIDAAFSERNIQKSEYALFAGFYESLIQNGIGYLEQVHIFTSAVTVMDPLFLIQLGKILSPFSSILFFKSSLPPDGTMLKFDEFVFETASKLADGGSTAAVRATAVRRDVVLVGDPKRIRLLCNTTLITDIPSRGSKEERIRIHLQVWANIRNNGYKR